MFVEQQWQHSKLINGRLWYWNELTIALSVEKVSITGQKYISVLYREPYPSIENQLKILKEEMETYLRQFNTFIDFVNAKLDANKDENIY